MGRIALIPVTLVGITLVTFLLLHSAPGDPATVRAAMGRGVSSESIAALRAEFDLDRPLAQRYLAWLKRSATLDFGHSLVDGRPVRARIFEALPITLGLALLATALAFALAVPLGCALALYDKKSWTRAALAILSTVYALPAAAVGMWLLAAGAPYGSSVGGVLAAAICLASAALVRLSRHQRSALLGALRADYVRTAQAKGGGTRLVIAHALRNALLPTVTLLSAELPTLLSGAIVVEQVFGIHGLGLLAFDAVLARDYPLLLGLTSFGAVVTLLSVLAADLLYGAIDPRVRV